MAKATYVFPRTEEVVVEEEKIVLELTLDEARAISARMSGMHTAKSDKVFGSVHKALDDLGIVGFGYFKTTYNKNEAETVARRDVPLLRDKRDPQKWNYRP